MNDDTAPDALAHITSLILMKTCIGRAEEVAKPNSSPLRHPTIPALTKSRV
jgi:hypothetical protein